MRAGFMLASVAKHPALPSAIARDRTALDRVTPGEDAMRPAVAWAGPRPTGGQGGEIARAR